MHRFLFVILSLFSALPPDEPLRKIGEKLPRRGDEIMVCGQLYHTTTKVVLWTDPGGYDAYRVEPRFRPVEKADRAASEKAAARRPLRYGMRGAGLSPAQIERVRGGGWDLPLLAGVVDQLVIHFDARGTSRKCFEILHDVRNLSVHFMLDLDGTIYQTLDVKEAAWHATIANERSIGVEVANIGAYEAGDPADPLPSWYKPDAEGRIRIVIPIWPQSRLRPDTAAEPLRPVRDERVAGTIQDQKLEQYDFTPQQYDALSRLAATLCRSVPKDSVRLSRVTHVASSSRTSSPTSILPVTKASSGTITYKRTRSTPAPPSSGTG